MALFALFALLLLQTQDDGIKALEGDVFEIEAPPFGLPLRNPLQIVAVPPITVKVL